MTENVITVIGNGDSGSGGAAGRRDSTPSLRLLMTLAAAGMLAGLLIVVAYQLTLPRIERNRAARLEAAVLEVVPHSVRFDPLYLYQGKLVKEPPPAVDRKKLDAVYLAYDAAGKKVGYAILSGDPGFADVVDVLFGYQPGQREILGMKALEQKETPGLGSRIETDTKFIEGFQGAVAPLHGVHAGMEKTKNDVDVITGATISSKTVIRAINKGEAKWGPLITAWEKGGGS